MKIQSTWKKTAWDTGRRRLAHRLLLLPLIGPALLMPLAARAADPVSFAAGDGGKVYADVYAATTPVRATILVFHQAGSNRHEYAPIAPRLAAQGFRVLAVDQRSGGERWGQVNQTAAEYRRAASHFEALPDLEGALAYVQRTWPATPVIVVGSSYSASLVFFLAAQHPGQIAALLSFSPGEYFDGHSVRAAAAQVQCPVFISSSPEADEVAEAKRLLDAVPVTHKTQYVPVHGVHGASALRADANPRGNTEAWSMVEAFLDAQAPRVR